MFTDVSSGGPLFAQMSPREFNELVFVLMGAGAVLLGFIIFLWILRRLLHICGPHQILVFSGRSHRLPDGTVANYKIIHGGRGFRIPLLEKVTPMDMRLFPVEVTVQNAYSSGGIPLTVRAIANIKLSSNPIALRNAVERFLDYHPSQIAVAAQQTLEGVLREVVSQLTPEEVNEDRLKFAGTLIENARDDFDKLGLELDVLKVQHVADDQEYLTNMGRPRIAGMLRDAENAENAANQTVAEAKAEARQAAETATKQAETRVVQSKNTAAAELAELDARAREADNQASMAAETARARAEQRLQQLRSELEKLRLHCDVVLPAAAQRKAAELKSRGEAAPAVQNGKASAEALRLIANEWAAAGDVGREVYVLQQLHQLVDAAAKRVARSEIGTIKLVGDDHKAYSAVLASYPAAVIAVLEELGHAVGIDIGALLGRHSPEGEGRGELPRRPTLRPGLPVAGRDGVSRTAPGIPNVPPPPPLPQGVAATQPGRAAVEKYEGHDPPTERRPPSTQRGIPQGGTSA
jgi:flotillin